MRLEHAGLARQMKIPQARDPEAQGPCAQEGREEGAFGRLQGAHRFIGREHGLGRGVAVGAGGPVDAPVIEADRQIKQPGVDPGKVKIKKTGQLLAFEHHVVAKQVGMHRATGQGGMAGLFGHMVLIGQFAHQKIGLLGREMGQHHGHGLVPPRQTAQIGLASGVVLACQVHARQHGPHRRAMDGLGRELALSPQAIDHGRWLSTHLMQDGAVGVGRRVGHWNAALRQVLHEVKVKGQLCLGQAFKQGEHILARIGTDKVIGVFNAPFNAAKAGQLAQVQGLHQRSRIVFRDFGKDRHGM